MQQRVIVNKGKRFLVNVATEESGVGAGFAEGQLVLKSITDKFWYVITDSGSVSNVAPFVSQSQLSYYGTSSFYDINYPYQLLQANNNNKYAVYLSGTAPAATLVVSQSAYTGSAEAKPYLLLQNITDRNYYRSYLSASGTTITLVTSQTVVSQSWVHPIF
jgi:hypothetical protein